MAPADLFFLKPTHFVLRVSVSAVDALTEIDLCMCSLGVLPTVGLGPQLPGVGPVGLMGPVGSLGPSVRPPTYP